MRSEPRHKAENMAISAKRSELKTAFKRRDEQQVIRVTSP